MKSVLVVESSATRRRVLDSLLQQRDWKVIVSTGARESCETLAQSSSRALKIDAVVLGWPEQLEPCDQDLLELLHAEHLQHVPVVVLADESTELIVKWRMMRPRTSLLMWSEYAQIVNQLEQTGEQLGATKQTPQTKTAQRVLLVDDSPTVRTGFRRLMEKHGYEVETADNVDHGLKLALTKPFDIAIIDYFMPGKNGTALITELRKHPKTRHILCAIITGTYSDDIIVESLASGAVECLFKSESRELFIARLASLARTVQDSKAIDAERRRLEGILEAVGDGVFGVAADGNILFINPAALQILGYQDAHQLIGRPAHDVIHSGPNARWDADGSSPLAQAYRNGETLSHWESVFWTASRLPIPVEGTVQPLHVDGARRGSVVAFRDVSEQRKMQEKLRWQAEHDCLTGLHNRAWFERHLVQELQRLKHQDGHDALLFIDLDRFKYINDTAGHSAGDRLLVEVSRRLQALLRPGDTIARMGGDEYAMLLRDIAADDIAERLERLCEGVSSAPFTHAGKTYHVTLSIGATAIDRDTISPEVAMAQADLACYQSKKAGRARGHVYNPSRDDLATMSRELGWSSRLQEALAQDSFELAYQPIVPLEGIDRESGDQPPAELWQRQLLRNPEEPMRFEVLLRLRDPNGDLVQPTIFLPAAERFGLMLEIDRWVIRRAIRALHEARHHHRALALNINLSADSLKDETLVAFITDCLVQHNIEPESLTFEIAESRALEDITGVQSLLRELRALGCHIAIDDFGTSFATFSYLRQLDVTFLKIAGNIVQGLPGDPLDRTVIAALASIAEITGKQSVAEWVESAEALQALYECGVTYAQGVVIGHPRLQLLPGPRTSADDHPQAAATPLASDAVDAPAPTDSNVISISSRRR